MNASLSGGLPDFQTSDPTPGGTKIDWKPSVKAATAAAIANLSSVAVANFAGSGVTVAQGHRVLVKDNASPDGVIAQHAKYNGLYVVGPVVGGNAALTRAPDCDEDAEVTPGLTVNVEEGAAAEKGIWTLPGPGTFVVGTDALTFSKASLVLSGAAPQPLGVAAAGVSPLASRDDHVHFGVAVTNGGAGNAGAGLKLDAAGKVAGFILEDATSDTGTGAPGAGKLVKLDAAGKIDGRDIQVDGVALDAAVADIAAATSDTGGGAGNVGKLVELDAAGKIDGRDIQVDGAKLDGIEALADVTDLANVTTALGTAAAAAVNASAGAGDAGKLAKLDAAGKWDASMIPGGGDATAIHEDVAGEIAALTDKAAPVVADKLLIEDSAAANAKKRVDIGNLPVATGAAAGYMAAADKSKLDGIEALADVTDAANVDAAGAVMNSDVSTAAMSFVIDEDNMVSDSATKVPTQQSVKAYVDSRAVGQLAYKGGYNAATNTPDLDTAPSGVKKGDFYTVTAAGTFFAAAVEVGDALIAEVDAAAAEADWTIVQANLTAATIKTQYESNADTNAFTDAEQAKLAGIEALADVTDDANVRAALAAATAAIAINGQDLTGADEIALNDAAAGATEAGRLRRNGTQLEYHDGTASRIVYKASGTDVPVADGGTGASDAGTARTNLGLAIGSDVQAYDADLAALAGIAEAEGILRKSGAGTAVVMKTNLGAAVAPTVNEDSGDGYSVGSIWLDTTAKKVYLAVSVGVGTAEWVCLGDFAVTDTELGYLNGVTSAIQTQIDGKAASAHNHNASDINAGTLATARGGFGADVSQGLTNGHVARVSGNAITVGAMESGDVPTILTSKELASPQTSGAAPAAAADKVGYGVADINDVGTAAEVRSYEGGATQTERVNAAGVLKVLHISESVAGDGTIALAAPTAGRTGLLEVMADTGEYGKVRIASDGSVNSLEAGVDFESATFIKTDTDTNLCVFSNGGVPTVKNRLGGARWLIGTYRWS